MFMEEGLFMYLKADDVKGLVRELLLRFPGSELVCEVFNSAWLKGAWGTMVHRKLQQRLKMGKEAHFHSGLAHPHEMEDWDPRIRYVDDWSYFDTGHPRLGAFRFLKSIPFLRNIQYTVHYQLLGE
jgi:O-methyltransferase involved in polyketide biosynthesis